MLQSEPSRVWKYATRHKFSNFHLIFINAIWYDDEVKQTFNTSIFEALAIIMSNFHWNVIFP